MPHPPSNDRRHFSRISFHAPAMLRCGHSRCSVEVLDLSLNGALLRLPEDWLPRTTDDCQLDIPLHEDIHIHMHLALSHRDGCRAGFRCLDLDLDSMSHLRRMVELNTGDPELLQRELSELAG
ncbi:MAG: PilZ domain-containing protein [Ectothiorhodospiraceae bacterium]|nr:PilZ domain-containing protein [Ectothiorhodospiraceae bacterium]MCH8505517.1 PilZ domain-containing protein [Ectothiorhodospiraceae bacterium]